jgi:hypothetical protein
MRAVALAAAAWLSLGSAWAHGLGQRYDLPIPLWMYLAGAGAAVAVSFAFLALFRGDRVHRRHRVRTRLRGRIPYAFVVALEAASVLVFALLVVAGLVGRQSPFKNITPTTIWVLWWVGFSFVAAFACNLWPLVNPAAVIFRWGERLWRQLRGTPLPRPWRYPARVGAWPAVALFWLFAWIELVAPDKDAPRSIALAMLLYAALFWTGSFLFGPGAWARAGDPFTVAFGLLGRFAPLQVAGSGRSWRWWLQPYPVGLLRSRVLPLPSMFFTLLMLSTVTVDGFLETPAWAAASEFLQRNLGLGEASLLPPTVPLIAGPFLFVVAYAVVIVAMARLTNVPKGALLLLARRFVLSLVPIAIGYHLAHYLSFLLVAGQLIIPLASDPFGWGWDLFGTMLYRIDIGIVDARFVWITSVVAIVAAHVIATLLAHETALELFPSAAEARRSQYPMLCLMIAYTVTSLWILAQPIVETKVG